MKTSPIEILWVEDNAADQKLINDLFLPGRRACNLSFVVDGMEAMDFLERRGNHTGARRPHLIFLDLNLPRVSGRDFLTRLKTLPQFRCIPVIIVTTSNNPVEIQDCYSNHAAGYLCKPQSLDGFSEMMAAIRDYWLNCAHLPD